MLCEIYRCGRRLQAEQQRLFLATRSTLWRRREKAKARGSFPTCHTRLSGGFKLEASGGYVECFTVERLRGERGRTSPPETESNRAKAHATKNDEGSDHWKRQTMDKERHIYVQRKEVERARVGSGDEMRSERERERERGWI
jgi:hypothetical protein